MDLNLVLLVTSDRDLDQLVIATLRDSDIAILRARNVDEALKIVCEHCADLRFAIIDLDEGCHGMTFLSAINSLRAALPVVVMTGPEDAYHVAALAYANKAAACLAKPISAAELRMVLHDLDHAKLELTAA